LLAVLDASKDEVTGFCQKGHSSDGLSGAGESLWVCPNSGKLACGCRPNSREGRKVTPSWNAGLLCIVW